MTTETIKKEHPETVAGLDSRPCASKFGSWYCTRDYRHSGLHVAYGTESFPWAAWDDNGNVIEIEDYE